MSDVMCPLEEKVVRYIQSGEHDFEMERHIESCEACGQTVLVSSWMRDFRRVSMKNGAAAKKLPTAGFLWEQATRSKRADLKLKRLALAPLLIPRILTIILVLTVAILGFFSKSGVIRDFLLKNLALKQMADIMQKMLASSPMVAVPLVLTVVVVIGYFLYTLIHPEEA